MSKLIYIDTNVYLDLFLNRQSKYLSYADISQSIFNRSVSCEFYILISDLVIYELRKKVEKKDLDDFFHSLSYKLRFTEVIKSDYASKFKIHSPDNAHISCAIRNNCDAIITNDKDFFEIKEIPTYQSPSF